MKEMIIDEMTRGLGLRSSSVGNRDPHLDRRDYFTLSSTLKTPPPLLELW